MTCICSADPSCCCAVVLTFISYEPCGSGFIAIHCCHCCYCCHCCDAVNVQHMMPCCSLLVTTQLYTMCLCSASQSFSVHNAGVLLICCCFPPCLACAGAGSLFIPAPQSFMGGGHQAIPRWDLDSSQVGKREGRSPWKCPAGPVMPVCTVFKSPTSAAAVMLVYT